MELSRICYINCFCVVRMQIAKTDGYCIIYWGILTVFLEFVDRPITVY